MTAVTEPAKQSEYEQALKQQGFSNLPKTDLEALRCLLMGPDYAALLQHKLTLENPELLAKHISPILSEALRLDLQSDQSQKLQRLLNPVITQALFDSVENNPKPLADALYPVMGPAIRKSINATMSQMLSSFNDLLEQSFSPKSLSWRFDAWRTGRRYAEVALLNSLEYQVEQVFLIHKETGLMLQHVLAETAISKDPDMVSAMLTAIQDFISDTFTIEENSGLNSLKLGDLTVLIEQGPFAVIAIVVRGSVPQWLQNTLTETIEKIHQQGIKRLKSYDGSPEQFEDLQTILSQCLKIKRKKGLKAKKKSNHKLLWLLLLPLIVGMAYISYNYSQKNQAWERIQQQLGNEPGLVITSTTKQDGVFRLSGLIDPLARKPAEIIGGKALKLFPIALDFRTYLSLEPDIILARAKHTLLVPPSVALTFKDGMLFAKGSANSAWIQQFRLKAPLITGIQLINLNQLKLTKK